VDARSTVRTVQRYALCAEIYLEVIEMAKRKDEAIMKVRAAYTEEEKELYQKEGFVISEERDGYSIMIYKEKV
jgi:hypothetical protein